MASSAHVPQFRVGCIVVALIALDGCFASSSGGSFAILFNLGVLVIALYAGAERWTKRDFRRPGWLEAFHQIAVVIALCAVLSRGIGFGDEATVTQIGGASFAALGLAMECEVFLTLTGAPTDLQTDLRTGSRKLYLIGYGLTGLLALAVGAAVVTGVAHD